jgi:hypothetical protein
MAAERALGAGSSASFYLPPGRYDLEVIHRRTGRRIRENGLPISRGRAATVETPAP